MFCFVTTIFCKDRWQSTKYWWLEGFVAKWRTCWLIVDFHSCVWISQNIDSFFFFLIYFLHLAFAISTLHYINLLFILFWIFHFKRVLVRTKSTDIFAAWQNVRILFLLISILLMKFLLLSRWSKNDAIVIHKQLLSIVYN